MDTQVSKNMSSARIQLHLDVHEPIELVEMTLSFQALAFEYRKFLNEKLRSNQKKARDDIKLYITDIRHNCILAEIGSATEILGVLIPALPTLDALNIFMEFVRNIGTRIEYFKNIGVEGKVDPGEVEYSKAECARVNDILKVVSKNKSGQLGLNVIDYEEEGKDYKVKLRVNCSSEEAIQASRGTLIAQQALEHKGDADHKNVLMYFYQTNIDDPKSDGRTGDKAIIKSIAAKEQPVYFISELDQQKIAYLIHDKKQNPLKVSFNVDVNVETDKNDKPRFYRVVKVHDIYTDEDE